MDPRLHGFTPSTNPEETFKDRGSPRFSSGENPAKSMASRLKTAVRCRALHIPAHDRSHRDGTVPFPADRAISGVSAFSNSNGVAPGAGALLESLRQQARLASDQSPLRMDISGVYTCHRMTMTGHTQVGYGSGSWSRSRIGFQECSNPERTVLISHDLLKYLA